MPFINKNIKIASIEATNGRYKIKDSEGNSYSFFEKKQDGTNSQAYEHFTMGNFNGPFTIGSSAKISYTENPGKTKSGDNVVYKNITSMFQTVESAQIGHPVPVVSEVSEPVLERNESREAFGKRLAIHGMANGRLAAGTPPAVVGEEIYELFKLEDTIEQALKNRPQENIDVSDIPF